MDREKVHAEAFTYSRYKPLSYRLEVLTSEIFSGIRIANPEVWRKIKETLESKASAKTLDDLVIGTALTIEAYQIDTGRNIVQGFANIPEAEIDKIGASFRAIPDSKDLTPSIIDRPARQSDGKGLVALADDIQLIGELTVERNPIAMRYGAWAAASALSSVWQTIYTPALPYYEPSRYKSDNPFL
jgi:hypothetical protein